MIISANFTINLINFIWFMFTFINSSLHSIKNSPIPMKYFSESTEKYVKIAAVTIAIFSALTVIYLIYRRYKATVLSPDEAVIPPHLAPQPIKNNPNQKPDSPLNQNQGKKASPQKSVKDLDQEGNDNKKDLINSHDQKKKNMHPKSDEEIAKELQQQMMDEDDLDQDNTPTENDEEIAKRLQQQYDREVKKSPLSPLKPKDIIESPKPVEIDLSDESPAKKAQEIGAAKQGGEALQLPLSPFNKIEKACAEISENIFTNPSFSAVDALSVIDSKMENQIRQLLDEMVVEFERRNPFLQKIKYGEQVPEYFANVQGFQSTEERKYLSLVGIRNLFKHGPRIIDDFRKQQFLGGEHHYNYNEGLKAFKYYTGNVVDLDTEIDAINDTEALKQAEQMIINFGKICGLKKSGRGELTADEVARQFPNRKLDLPKSSMDYIHTSMDHLDRSNHGIWKREAPKTMKTYYYVNVPNPDIVLLATLRMPLLLAELAYRSKEQNHGKLPKEFFDEFFDKGLSDMCFNDKARTFMNFYHTWSAKLDGEVTDPEEDVRRKLAKGVFGADLQKKDPKTVVKEAFTRDSLMSSLTGDYAVNGRTLEKFLADEQGKIIDELKSKGKWEATLYHNAAGDDYFLLNQSTLNVFIKDLYTFMLYM